MSLKLLYDSFINRGAYPTMEGSIVFFEKYEYVYDEHYDCHICIQLRPLRREYLLSGVY